ncbi:hypothetical protein NQ318_005244, partial [Aromia moschata]
CDAIEGYRDYNDPERIKDEKCPGVGQFLGDDTRRKHLAMLARAMYRRRTGSASMWVFVFLVVCADATPIIIRTGVVKNLGQQEEANLFDAAHHKGIANFEEDEGFNKGSERKHVASTDSGHYGEENGIKKDHLDQNQINKEQFFRQGGGAVSDFGNKLAHKKGHHKSGFQNSYHKDEQGSNSSFFDDSEDLGDQYVYKTNKGTYGNMGHDRHLGHTLDNSHYANEGAKRGLYDTAGAYDKDYGVRQNHRRNNYYDGREEAGRRNAAANYGEGGRFQEERYLDRPYHPVAPPLYVDQYPKPPMHRKRITIYEDPRYSRGAPYPHPHAPPHHPRYADDLVDLDIRPGGSRYDRRPPHYYY